MSTNTTSMNTTSSFYDDGSNPDALLSLFGVKVLFATVLWVVTIAFGGGVPLLIEKYAGGDWQKRIVTMGNVFSSGVFLAVAFSHVLPESNESFEALQELHDGRPDVPIPSFVCLLGFVIVLIIEKGLMSGRQNATEMQVIATATASRARGDRQAEIVLLPPQIISQYSHLPPSARPGASPKWHRHDTESQDDHHHEHEHSLFDPPMSRRNSDTDVADEVTPHSNENSPLIAARSDDRTESKTKARRSRSVGAIRRYDGRSPWPIPTVVRHRHDEEHHEHVQTVPHDHHHIVIDSTRPYIAYVLALVLSIHSAFGGLAIGVSTTHAGANILFFSVASHKFAEAFSFGVAFLVQKVALGRFFTILLVYSLSTPLGTIIGALIVRDLEDGEALLVIEMVVNALAAGTFVYIGVMDVLAEEFSFDPPVNRWILIGIFVIGLGLISGVTVFE